VAASFAIFALGNVISPPETEGKLFYTNIDKHIQ
jgi:hypothetical protein